MKILQYNVQSLISNRRTIEYYINNNLVDICFFSEIFDVDECDSSGRLLNFDTFCKPSERG